MGKDKNKLKTIGKLAHDLNNVLSPLLGYTELAIDEVEPDSSAANNLKQVYKVANQARDLVQKILDISRLGDKF
jgi:signal transduction histidine kinase